MKTKLFLIVFICILTNLSGQESKIYPKVCDVDSLINIDGLDFSEYLSNNLIFPLDGIQSGRFGTYIGCIRLDSIGRLINVFTINSLNGSIDKQFENLVKSTWKKRKIKIGQLSDTTDIFVPILYTFSNGLGQDLIDFNVDRELAPKFMSNEVIIVAFSPEGTITFENDEKLIKEANDNFAQQKYRNCIYALDELIKRNPYNPDLIFMRAKVFNALDKKDLACHDYRYLKDFLGSNKYEMLDKCKY